MSHTDHIEPLAELSVQNLACVQGRRHLYSGLSFCVRAGQVLLVTGENGAGKTSLLKQLTGSYPLSAGSICWQGMDIHHDDSNYLQEMLWLGHQPPFKPEISARDQLTLLYALRPNADCSPEQALARVGLGKRGHQLVSSFSAGMQRRLALASLLVCEARIWLLDEPQTALDAAGIQQFESLITEFTEQGGCVVMTSHHPVRLDAVSVIPLVLGGE
jgi:heme exporter protein A